MLRRPGEEAKEWGQAVDSNLVIVGFHSVGKVVDRFVLFIKLVVSLK